jgi:GDPmannose 4,6-dehydratase
MKNVLIIGITGMDGSIAADLWLSNGYNVHGIVRRCSNFNTQRIEHIFNKITLHYGDLTDMGNIINIIKNIEPEMILNFGAMSHVKVSFELESYTFQANTLGILNILQAVKILNMDQKVKIYHASTSEMYGNITNGKNLLTETSPMIPVSPYGIAKLAAYHLCNYYKTAYNMFVVSSILLNHEGERRGNTFVTKKIADYVGKYKNHKDNMKPLILGNLDAKRDWGYANDYVYGIWLMMNAKKPDNYVLATRETHSVREFVEKSFNVIGINIEWIGSNENEVGINHKTKEILVKVDSKYYRPIEIDTLIGDYSKAYNELGWYPETSFDSLVERMVKHSISLFQN